MDDGDLQPGSELSTVARIVLVGWDGGGAVQPLLGLTRRLVERGHDVHLLGTSTLRGRVRDVGAAFHSFQHAQTWTPRTDRMVEEDRPRFTLHLLGPEMAVDVIDSAERLRPDLFVVDHMALGALCGAEHTGVPTAVLVHSLYRPWVDGSYAAEWARGRFILVGCRARIGLAPLPPASGYHHQMWERANVVLVACPAELDEPPSPLPARTHYVGPMFVGPMFVGPAAGAAARPASVGPPLVLVSLSSMYRRQENLMQRILDAFIGLDTRGIATAGDCVDPDALRVPSNVDLRRYVPHAALLPTVSAVICHGGLLTIVGALAHGVPTVCLPDRRDTEHNAARMVAGGAGLMLGHADGPAEIRSALAAVLAPGNGFAAASRAVADRIAEYGDGARAVGLLESLVPAASPASR